MTEKHGAESANGNGDAQATTNAGTQDERASWTTNDWEDWAAREADRRVNDAQKKWRNELSDTLTAKDKDAEARVQDALTKAEQAETRAAFVERANTASIVDVKAAWALVNSDSETYRDRRGNVDFDKLKTEHPALFGAGETGPRSVAGRQADTGAGTKTDMNALLRGAVSGG